MSNGSNFISDNIHFIAICWKVVKKLSSEEEYNEAEKIMEYLLRKFDLNEEEVALLDHISDLVYEYEQENFPL